MLNRIITYTIALLSLLLHCPVSALTLDEAISLARENLPSYKAALIKVKSSEALYNASLGPFLPGLDASTSQKRFYTSVGEFATRSYDLTLSYTLFDGGRRSSNRNIARLTLHNDSEDLRKTLIDLEYNVKTAFYSALARKEILEQRKIQLEDAMKDYEVAEGRRKFGVAKLSDVLQASVRLEQARFNLVQAEGDYKKTLFELYSLTGSALDSGYGIEGALNTDIKPPGLKRLSEAVLQKPEIKQAENLFKISENNKSLAASAFYPSVSTEAAYTKTGGGGFRFSYPEEKTVGFSARWNIFELGKFFKYSSSKLETDVTIEKLNDIKRQLLLDVYKTYEDFLTVSRQLAVSRQQLKNAEHNYSQALGEYKVGKADILSLVQAESQLASAREQMVNSKLNFNLSLSLLERTAGIRFSESAQENKVLH